MARTITASVVTELQLDRIRPRTLVHFNFDGGAVRLCDDIRDIVFDGNTFTGVGHLGKVSPVNETAGLRANGINFTLSGIPSSLIDESTGQHVQGRTVEMWKAFLDSGDALIADPIKVFAGRIDQMIIADAGDTVVITVSAENRLVDLDQPLETRFYTDQDQQSEFAGDLGMEFVTKMQSTIFVWGRAKLDRGTISITPDANSSGEAPVPVSTPAPDISTPDTPDPDPSDNALDQGVVNDPPFSATDGAGP